MPETQDGVQPQHPRPGIPHDLSHLLTALTLIAVDGAIGAGRFVGAKPAAVEPHGGVIQEVLAFEAKGGCGAMLVPAITTDHRGHGLPFARQSLV